MRLSLLVEELSAKFDPERLAGEDVSASATRTTLVAQMTALDAARAGSVGRGLQLAAEELHELAVLTSSQDDNIRLMAENARSAVADLRQVLTNLNTGQFTNTTALRAVLSPLKEQLSLLVCDLVRKISSMPLSLGDYEAPQSADRVQIETLLRQAMVNGRDRLTAIEIVVEALLLQSQNSADIDRLISLDTDDLDYSTRQRLAALTRDKRLDDSILTTKTAH